MSYPSAGTSGGAAPASFLSDGAAKAAVIKATGGQLYGISMGNTGASPVYLRIYNQGTSPGTSDVPVQRFMIPGNANGSGREKLYPVGIQLASGISYRVTTGAADNNDTACAANEVTISFDYQ